MLSGERGAALASNLLTPGDQARAAPAGRYLLGQVCSAVALCDCTGSSSIAVDMPLWLWILLFAGL